MDTFQPSQITSPKLPEPVMGGPFASCSSAAACHSPKASISIEDLDILDGPDALCFFEQEALLIDASSLYHSHSPFDVQTDLGLPWNLDELDVAQHTSTAAIETSRMRHSPSMSHRAEHNTVQQKEVLQLSKLSSLPLAHDRSGKTHPFSRFKFANNASKLVNLVDSDGMEDGNVGHMRKTSSSKNIVSERKRRRKLNEKLYSLRSLVPKISKMDKASIVYDAINYVQNLQNLVKDIQDEILTLQTRASGDTDAPHQCPNGGLVSVTSTLKEVDYKILKVDVAKMEETTYNLRILCVRGRGVFVKLAKALESLQFEIVNANLTSIKDHTLNMIFMKAKDGRTMEPRELREMILEVVPRFGLGLAEEGKDLRERKKVQ